MKVMKPLVIGLTEPFMLLTPSCWITHCMTPSPSDFSNEVIRYLMGRIQTWHTEQTYIDIGTPGH